MSNGLRVVFTGGGEGLGAELVQRLGDLGHSVFTFGLGCTYPLDFRFLSPIKAGDALGKAAAFLKGAPDVLIHNARMAVGDLGHALYCNINARVILNRAFLKANEGDSKQLRIIDIGGHTPEWATTAEVPMISQAAQRALCFSLADLGVRARRERTKILKDRKDAYFTWAKQNDATLVIDDFEVRGFCKKGSKEPLELPPDLDPTKGRKVWVPCLDIVRLKFDLLGTTIGKFNSEFVMGKIQEAMNVATVNGYAAITVQ